MTESRDAHDAIDLAVKRTKIAPHSVAERIDQEDVLDESVVEVVVHRATDLDDLAEEAAERETERRRWLFQQAERPLRRGDLVAEAECNDGDQDDQDDRENGKGEQADAAPAFRGLHDGHGTARRRMVPRA
jgi:hypothetical protein